ncbi:type IV pilus biogenesis protein PilM [Parageobacillus thermoglucosidasius]|uniref:type IV pilus biogenesis protein PilM n=1 Tax=Parageobacillus thermoglucosidasius TaxID=1426 RepID=UPI002E1A90DF|nr:pilus assembly protein PilM [Parageobacillus thermoglucosidasius]MED4912458.1 pilus assembly protein PilM [Parageobacillus thermoglucosidasius]MED4944250.1 pilus assembly protein PilM [Parageobacillus thermoglucosidasius]MED4981848.1 pilus assembly protein PilM [Parageobacillus thermoglucosidasius]
MLTLFQPRHKVANLVIKDHVIRYVETKANDPLSVHKWGERQLPKGMIHDGKIMDRETLGMILEECVDEWKLKKRRVRFIVPDPFVIIRRLPLPADLEEEEIRGYLFMELGTTIPLPFDTPVFDYVVLEKTQEATVVLLFAAPEDSVLSYVQLLEAVKLRPIAADVSPLCAYRLFYMADQVKKDDHILLIQFDQSSVNVSAFDEHKPVFMRHLSLEQYEQIKLEEEQQLVDPFEDVYKEMERMMSFYSFSIHQGTQQITRVFLMGDHPHLSHVYQALQERLDVPVERLAAAMAGAVDACYHLAWGLGLKEGNDDVR